MKEVDVLLNRINDLQDRIRVLEASLSSGQQSYDITVTPANYSHMHKPSSLLSGNLGAAINFTTRPTYNGADIIVDGDPVGLQADDDSTRLGVDADTAVTTGTKVLHVSLVDQSGNAMEAQDLAGRAGFQKVTDGTNTLALVTHTQGYNAANRGIIAFGYNVEANDYFMLPMIQHGDTVANKTVYRLPVTNYTEERTEGIKISNGTITSDVLAATSTAVPDLDGSNLFGTHSLVSYRKDPATTEGATRGPYSVTLNANNLGASQDFIVIDKSDTANFPHTTATGSIHVTSVHLTIDGSSAWVGDICLGFLENVDADNGDYHCLLRYHMERGTLNIVEHDDFRFDPLIASSTYHLTDAISLNDAGFQTDVALGSPFDNTAAYTTVSGDGDLAFRVIRTAGNIDFNLNIKYYVA